MSYTVVNYTAMANTMITSPTYSPGTTALTNAWDPTFYSQRGTPRWLRQEEFEEFHKEHPEVYAHLFHMMDQFLQSTQLISTRGSAKTMTRQRISIRRWLDIIRYEYDIKVNNNHSSFYARLLQNDFPGFAHFIPTRGKL